MSETILKGIPAAPGIIVGKAHIFGKEDLAVPAATTALLCGDPERARRIARETDGVCCDNECTTPCHSCATGTCTQVTEQEGT